MVMLEVMEKYHWTYAEYLDTDTWVVDAAIQKMSIQAKLAEQEQNKHGR